MAAKYPEVNGAEVSYCSIEFDIDGHKLAGVLAINYGETTEVGKPKGNSRKPIGRTAGNSEFEGDIEILHKEWKALLPKLTQNGKLGFSETSWTVSVTYAEPTDPTTIMTDKLVGVRFLSPKRQNAEGTDALAVTLTMDPMDIVWDSRYVGLRRRA